MLGLAHSRIIITGAFLYKFSQYVATFSLQIYRSVVSSSLFLRLVVAQCVWEGDHNQLSVVVSACATTGGNKKCVLRRMEVRRNMTLVMGNCTASRCCMKNLQVVTLGELLMR